MKNNLLFNFDVDKATNKVHVTREFAAEVSLVWEAWTNPEILDQWWAPKPYKTVTKSMDFKEGGTWLYAMISPENVAHWCRNDYTKINPLQGFESVDAFCLDDTGTINTKFPQTEWKTNFNEANGNTTVSIIATYQSLEDLEKIIALGFKEGFTMALENLDAYIEAQFKLRNSLRPDNTPRVTTYLNFAGNTEEAMLFYKKVFQTEFNGAGLKRFQDIPPTEGNPEVAENLKNMILYAELPILGNHILMATDAPKEMGFTLTQGNTMHICLEPETKEETQRLFNELMEGGKILTPLQDMFFGSYFGQGTDKFGINWMFNFKNS